MRVLETFQPCARCRRHVRSSEGECPFCGETVVAAPARPLPPAGLSRGGQMAWLLLFGASAVACASPGPAASPRGPEEKGGTLPPDAPPPVASGARPELLPPASADPPEPHVPFTRLTFDAGSHELRPEAAALLDAMATEMRRRPDDRIAVQGHSDRAEGGRVLPLSSFRARAVRDALVARGIAAQRFTVYAYGDDRPRGDAATPAGQTENRGVDVSMKPPPPPLPPDARFGVPIYGESGFMPVAGFGPGSATITPALHRSLEAVAEVLLAAPWLTVEVQGHAHSSEAKADPLAEQRAQAARGALVALGVPEDRLTARGYGTQAAQHGVGAGERAANRAVGFRIVGGGARVLLP